MWRKIIVIFCLISLAWPALTLAQDGRSYSYDEIAAKITVEQNSTLRVEERQTFNFIGEYHTAWRVIPLNKIDSITNVSVVDAATGQTLQWVSGEREKTDPNSWGKYTVTKDDGAVNIIWYYSAKDEQKTWILNYTVHGALEFRNDFDRLYWNIFTDYSVPIKKVNATVLLPQNFSREQVEFTAYLEFMTYRSFGQDFNTGYDVNDGFTFSANNLVAQDVFTIDAAWPRGAVDRGAYWRDWFSQHYGLIFSIIVALITFLSILYLWLKREVWPEKSKTIIAEYEPPQNLRPAEMLTIIKENFSYKALAATAVDLAVRGYLVIREDRNVSWFDKLRSKKFLNVIIIVMAMISFSIFGFMAIAIGGKVLNNIVYIIFSSSLLLFLLVIRIIQAGKSINNCDYELEVARAWRDDENLAMFEKKYLDFLFSDDKVLSLKKLASASNIEKQALYKKMQKFGEEIKKYLSEKYPIYSVNLMAEKTKTIIWVLTAIVFFGTIGLITGENSVNDLQYLYILITAMAGAVLFWSYYHFEARLNEQGLQLKRDILGFKLYLQTAERYRLQNLTPDLFEKFLPYAMIFGIEKKWAKNFEALGINISQPAWYVGGVYLGSGGGVGGFSASAFSASFSSSFSSAMASATGSGVGGGGAGGGGGGGGGGAG